MCGKAKQGLDSGEGIQFWMAARAMVFLLPVDRSVGGEKVNTVRKGELQEGNISAALELVEYLIANHNEIGIFRYPGRRHLMKKVLAMLEAGDAAGLKKALRPGMEMESSSALSAFIENLKTPLMPARVEELITAENGVIRDDVIAEDALGLLHEELDGAHLLLALKLLELLKLVSCNSRRSELSTISIATKLLPVFFHSWKWKNRWQQVSLIFHEMILLSKACKNKDEEQPSYEIS